MLTKDFNESVHSLGKCISYKVKNSEYDERYAKALYNLGLAYFNLGDFNKHEQYSSESLEVEKKLNGASSPVLTNIYLSLSTAYLELQEYDKALN